MIKISADKDADQREIYNKIVLCPICGQKLTDISYVNGVVILRVKCRRCKNYIRWVLSIPFFISCIRQQNP
ncbi:hypothetical protein KSX08_10015, partial [Bacteroides uniformis]|uniref:hypothetical protein n=1 Tax=Bacteroides uniformis TaxID=820 RepID=UPI001C377DDF